MPCYDERNSPAYINADWERRTVTDYVNFFLGN